MNRQKHKLSRRITAVLLTLAMLLSMVPAAFASEGESENTLAVKFNNLEIENNEMTLQLGTTKSISVNRDRVSLPYEELKFSFQDQNAQGENGDASETSQFIEISCIPPGGTESSGNPSLSSVYVKSLAVGKTEVTVSYTDSSQQQWSTTFTVEVVETGEINGIQVRAWNGSVTQESDNVFQINGNVIFGFDPVDSEGKSWSSHLYFSDVECALSNGDDLPSYIKNVFSSTAIQFRNPSAGISDTIVATIPSLKLNAGDTTDASTTFTVKTKAPEYTAALRLYEETNSPSVGIEEIIAALDELQIPYTSGSNYVEILGDNLSSRAELENLYSSYNSGLSSNWDMDEFLKFINEHFFKITEPEKYIIKPQHLSGYEKSYFNMNGNAGYFILTLDMAPGSAVEPIDENEKVTVTLVNRNGDGESETETFNKGEWINPIYDFQSDDPDYPVTGWTIDGESRYIQGPIVLEDNITLKAVNNVPDHYVRIVVLEDEEDTDLIHSESIDEIEDNGSIYTPKTIGEPQKTENGSNRDFTYKVSLTEYQKLYDGSYSDNETERAALYEFLNTKGLLQVDEINFFDTSVTQYKDAVAGQDIALADEGNIEKNSALTIATFVISFKPEEVTITPADITVYTGGDGYESVMDGTGETTVEANGLPTPGYLITLPESIDDAFFAGDQEAANLSGQIRFVYDGDRDGEYTNKDEDRVWNLDLYSEGESKTAVGEDGVARYVYRMDADSLSGTPIRMLFTDGNEEIISDDFEIGLETGLFKTYDMTIYPGLLESGAIKAQVLVDKDGDGVYSEDEIVIDNMSVNVGTATLTVRGTTNEEVIHAVGNDVDAVADNAHHITAVAPTDTKYYINESQVEVDPSNVSLLSDELVETEPLQEYIVNNDIADNGENFEYRYLDLVDNTNGNAYVTATNPVDVYWKIPEDADRDSLLIVHFNELDREYTDLDTMLANNSPDVYTLDDGLSVVEIGNEYYLKFSTTSFSPFVLVWNEDNPYYPPYDPGDDDEEEPDTPALDKVNHFLYVEGYPEDYRTGEYSDNEDLWPVKPQGNITRAEVATIFYRLLKDEVREEIETDVNSFPDVNEDDWFNVTVSSLANMGAISGYEDGTFRPNEPISRAELAAMAVRFYDTFEAEYEEGTFLDVGGDEWYADAIAAAEELGILGGYPDGTVRPNNNITRAETCAIVNRVLERRPHDEHLGDVEDMRTWPDNQPGAWYYADMQEATNGHYYEWIDIDGSKFEEWTEVDKDYDWTKR